MRFRRLAATLSATFDDALGRIENHEAVAATVVADARKAVAGIQVQSRRTAAELDRLEKALKEAVAQSDAWRERAKSCAEEDEERALACLKKAEIEQEKQTQLKTQIAEHRELVGELDNALANAQRQLRELTAKRASLSARGAVTKSYRTSNKLCEDINNQELFDRWEAAVTADELGQGGSIVTATDALTAEFELAEEDERLRAELAQLRKS
ncbi:MAG: hypothetical protein AAF541_13680 [Pseudomonadota bacterium]